MFVWRLEGNLQTALVRPFTVSCSNFVFPRNLNCCMQWCRSDGERKGCTQEKDKTSGVVVVQGRILSDGIGHVLCIVRTYMHTKALLNVFITLSHEMKILIFSATCFFCPSRRPCAALASISLPLAVHPHTASTTLPPIPSMGTL